MTCRVLMYHFVTAANGPFPGLKGVPAADFRAQLETLCRRFVPLTPDDVAGCARQGRPLPPDSFYLSFDDGTIDHYERVLPVLLDLGLAADFFPITEPLAEGRVSTIEKQRVLQYVTAPDYESFLSAFLDALEADGAGGIDALRPSPEVMAEAALYRPELDFYSPPERYYRWLRDTRLPPARFAAAIERLFAAAGYDEAGFVRAYYMGPQHLRELAALGMGVGGHSHTHADLTHLPAPARTRELARCRAVLEEITGAPVTRFAYPFGFSDAALAAEMRRNGWTYAFATGNRAAEAADADPFAWPRLDAASFFRAAGGP